MSSKPRPSSNTSPGLETPSSLPLWKPELPQSRFTKQANVVSQRAEARILHEGYSRDRVRHQSWPEAYIAVPEVDKKVKKRRWWQGNGGDRDLWR